MNLQWHRTKPAETPLFFERVMWTNHNDRILKVGKINGVPMWECWVMKDGAIIYSDRFANMSTAQRQAIVYAESGS